MRNYDDWKLNSGQEDEVIAGYCDECDGEIYEGEDIYKIKSSDVILHYNCWSLDYARQALDVWLEEAKKEE